EKRLAIYLRDGLACAWCGSGVETGTIFTLDHLVPHSKGGSNEATNLVTSCKRCNDSRGNRSVPRFADAVAGYLNHGVDGETIRQHVRKTSRRSLDEFLVEAKKLIERRGSVAKVLE